MSSLYKKLTFANILNLIGMRSFRLSRQLCSKFVLWAIKLNPSRNIFKENLANMGIDYDTATTTFQTKTVHFYSVPEGCKKFSQIIYFIDKNQTLMLPLPKVINTDFTISEKYQCEAKLPDTYLAELNNATVFAGTDLILVEKIALYDEIDRRATARNAIKSPVIKKVSGDELTLHIPTSTEKMIECGIHFAKDHSKNYFHWIVECLPRLSLVSHLDKNIPLLVDAHLPSQFFEALAVVNTDNRPLIKLQSNKCYHVKQLYYPSQFSVVHDNYDLPNYEKDAIYSPKALQFVRNTVLEKLNLTHQKPRRKIYLSRKTSHYRQVLNTTEIENFLVTQGFEIVFPENLSFFTQVQLFSEAEVIIGQSGAGMANFIFAPKECKILMLYNGAPQSNLHLFGALAAAMNLNLTFLIGKMSLVIPGIPIIHTDFCIDISLLAQFLKSNVWLKE